MKKNENQSKPLTKEVSSTDKKNPAEDTESIFMDFGEMPDYFQEHNEATNFLGLSDSDKEHATCLMLSKAQEIRSREKLEARVVTSIDEIIQADSQSDFQWTVRCQFNTCVLTRDFKPVKSLLLLKEGRIIAYGVAWQQTDGSWFIDLVEVVRAYRRSSFFLEVNLGNCVFRVGVLHVLVREFCDRFDRPLRVDACKTATNFVFRSCGFVSMSEDNPMILELR